MISFRDNDAGKKTIPVIEREKREKLGNRLKRLRLAHGLTQREVAEHMLMARKTVKDWESGRTRIRYPYVSMLADLFRVDKEYLWDPDYKLTKVRNKGLEEFVLALDPAQREYLYRVLCK